MFNEAETISTLRFGKRAKQIKNKPKINKEVSLQELKLLLEKAEKDIQERDRRIAMLEQMIVNIGGVPPGKSEKELKELKQRLKSLKNQDEVSIGY